MFRRLTRQLHVRGRGLGAITRNSKNTQNNLKRHSSTKSFSHWSQYEMGPPDPIVGLNEAFAADHFASKVNVGVGAYRYVHCIVCIEDKLICNCHNF